MARFHDGENSTMKRWKINHKVGDFRDAELDFTAKRRVSAGKNPEGVPSPSPGLARGTKGLPQEDAPRTANPEGVP